MRQDVLDRADYLAAWSRLHGGYDPKASRLVLGWLSVTYAVARPVARLGVAPGAISLVGPALGGGAVALASLGGRWLVAAAILVFLSGLLDSLDGAVALLRGRVTDWGYVLDSVADRCTDALYLLALWRVGAPAWAAVATMFLTFLQEYARARAAAAGGADGGGMREIGVVTVWERPTRVLVVGMALLAAGVLHGVGPSASEWADLAVGAALLLATVGALQLLVVVRRRLMPAPRAH